MSEFTKHRKSHNDFVKLETIKSPITKKTESSASEKVSKVKKEKQFFDCPQCPAAFSTKTELKVNYQSI